METSQIYAEEECHSCESGWTMYIGSPPNYDSSPSFSEEEGDDELVIDKDSYDENSDDSMASDASSGPTRYCMPQQRARGTMEAVDDKTSKKVRIDDDDDEPKVSWSSNYIIAPKMKKNKMKKNGGKEECVHSAKGGVADSKMERKKSWRLG
ncbi:hypothetical protein DM860_010024 [Cuscuta australis]|nr:hypothetical protein DM860_010024 [Cuscuta australis]